MIHLTTERLILRDPQISDLDSWHRLLSDTDNMYYLHDIMTKSVSESRENLEAAILDSTNPNRTKYFFAIEDKNSKEFIGSVGYTVTEASHTNRQVWAGYFILPEHHGKGYTTEAFTEVIRYAFEDNDVSIINTGCFAENRASERVMQKCGLSKDNEYNERVLHDGQMKDRLKYTITKDEWISTHYVNQRTDGVLYKLKSHFDFSFLSKYGKVFKVFDDQDSGNICFGVVNGDKKVFIKFAGAPTARSIVSTEDAIGRIKSTIPIYRDLTHPNLTKLIATDEIGGGFALVFEWTDGVCMGRMYPQSRQKFMQMPLETRMQVFDDVLTFHTHVTQKGYVAIDFHDGCIMYDFNINQTVICDIEFYAKAPYINQIGRMWGSSRFMSPEEYERGAVIDEITNVYTMGATAFAFFGDERNRSLEQWTLSKGLYDVAKRAISDECCQRQQSIGQFIADWNAASEER